MIGDNIHELAEKMAGKMSMVEQRLFLHRFMTWYARSNPEYNDPRLFTHHEDDFRSMVGYAGRAGPTVPDTSIYRQLTNRLLGRKR